MRTKEVKERRSQIKKYQYELYNRNLDAELYDKLLASIRNTKQKLCYLIERMQ